MYNIYIYIICTMYLKSKIFYPMIKLNRKKILLHKNILNNKYKYIIRLIVSLKLPILSYNLIIIA